MAIVFIINDNFKLGNIQDGMVVQHISNYVDAYIRIVNAIHNNITLNVLVRNSTCFKWLSRLKDQYGVEYVKIQENTPRNVLKQKWNLQVLPKEITNRKILEAKLLDLKIAPKKGESFQNIILENFYSNFLTYPELPIGKLVELLKDLTSERCYDNREIPLISQQYEKRLNEWKEKVKGNEIEKLIEILRNNPRHLQQELMNYKLVRNYPSKVGGQVLGENYYTLRRLNLDLEDIVVERSKVDKAINEIEFFLHDELEIKTLKDFETLLENISGELSVEFDVVDKEIHNLGNIITKELIEKVKDKFVVISDQISNDLKELDFLIPPARPYEPQSSWNAEQWIKWAINKYLPYQFWLEEQNQYDEEIASFSEKFADWFYKNFIELKTSFPRILHKLVPNICHEIRNNEGISLFLVIDNFNFKYMEDFRTLLNQRGFFCEKPQGYFSMIPNETEVCKKSLLSGEPERKSLGNKTYKRIIEEDWAGFIGGKKFIYLPNLGVLNEIRKPEHDVYFLNYRSIDELLHEDEDELGKPHREEIYHRLETLVDSVNSFAKRLGIEQKLSIYICSDHGSTKIQAQIPNPIDRKYYDAKSENKHHRFVTVSDTQIQNLPSHVESNCYVIRKEEYGLLENFLIAKGYSRFVRTTGKFYVHGGLSPEEVIVPFTVFRKVMAEPRELVVHLSQNVFRYSVKSTIRFDIGNINDYEVVNVEINIRNSNVECKTAKIKRIEPKSRTQIKMEARFKKILNKKETNCIMTRIRYQFLGKDYIQNIEPAIVIKSMVQGKVDLEDIF
ncbi:hypothetical protein ES707_07711 [subsurface metagenome]